MAFFPDQQHGWREVSRLMDSAGTIFITSHVNPDGDAIGSLTALSTFLRKRGKPHRVIMSSKTPAALAFLDRHAIIESFPDGGLPDGPPMRDDLVIYLDLSNVSRVGHVHDFLMVNEPMTCVIDHHQPEPMSADVAVINPVACSVGSLVYDMVLSIDPMAMDHDIAVSLLTAIVSDTGFFRFSNTTATTHLIAASLYSHDVTTREVRTRLESGYDFPRQKLLGLCMAEAELVNGGDIAYSVITTDMFDRSGALREHTEGIIDNIRSIRGVKIAFLAIQEGPEVFKVSFRTSDGYSANTVAARLGGGGHPKAAGATLHGDKDTVLARIIETSMEALRSEVD